MSDDPSQRARDTAPVLTRRTVLCGLGGALGAGWACQGAAGSGDEQKAQSVMKIPAWYYQHFDADYGLDAPEEGFGGWKQAELEFARGHTAVAVMHAWDMGTREQFPGMWRSVPYLARSGRIAREVFPPLLKAVRAAGLPLFHVVGGRDYYSHLPGYQRAEKLAGPPPKAPGRVTPDPVYEQLQAFRGAQVWRGRHNWEDSLRAQEQVDFYPEAQPEGDEGIANDSRQLLALCRHQGVNHLVYCGFAIDMCLLSSPGGMLDMQRHGVMCSALRQAVTAVENKETARTEQAKEIALWRVALLFGFVFDVPDFIASIEP